MNVARWYAISAATVAVFLPIGMLRWRAALPVESAGFSGVPVSATAAKVPVYGFAARRRRGFAGVE